MGLTFDTTFVEAPAAAAAATAAADDDEDDDDDDDDDMDNDPDWVSGLTPGGPVRASALHNKVD